MITEKRKEHLLDVVEALRVAVQNLDTYRPANLYLTPCVDCTHFDNSKDGGTCNKWGERPPVEYILKGCSEFDLDIPF